MTIIIDTIAEWNDIAIRENCLSNPELRAMSNSFGTKDNVAMIMMLADIAANTDLFISTYNKYTELLDGYLEEMYADARNVFINIMEQPDNELYDQDELLKLAIKESSKHIFYNERLLHKKKECHCYC